MVSRLPAIAAASAILIVTSAASPGIAGELPSPEKLIDAALALHEELKKADGEDDWIILSSIAQAQAHIGKYEEAVELARRYDGLFRVVILAVYVKVQAEVTGRAPTIPAGFSDEEWEQARVELAKCHADRGEFEQALKQLAAIRVNRGTAFFIADGYLSVAGVQLAAKRKGAALATYRDIIRVVGHISFAPHCSERLLSVVEGALRAGDRDLGKKAADLTNRAAAGYDRLNSTASHYQVEAWARAGRAWQLVGDGEKAKIAFQHAANLAERIGQDGEADPDEAEVCLSERVDAWTELAVMQFAAGFRADAKRSFSKASHHAGQTKDRSFRDYYLADIAEARFEAGDEAGARKGLLQIESPYWQAICVLKFAKLELRERRTIQARNDLQRAIELAKSSKNADNRADLTIRIAEAHAAAGNRPEARKAFRDALAMSNATQDKKYHQSIARARIRSGFLADAFQTTNEIPELEYRLLPLTELALQAARRKSENRRKPISIPCSSKPRKAECPGRRQWPAAGEVGRYDRPNLTDPVSPPRRRSSRSIGAKITIGAHAF